MSTFDEVRFYSNKVNPYASLALSHNSEGYGFIVAV